MFSKRFNWWTFCWTCCKIKIWDNICWSIWTSKILAESPFSTNSTMVISSSSIIHFSRSYCKIKTYGRSSTFRYVFWLAWLTAFQRFGEATNRFPNDGKVKFVSTWRAKKIQSQTNSTWQEILTLRRRNNWKASVQKAFEGLKTSSSVTDAFVEYESRKVKPLRRWILQTEATALCECV